MKILRSALGRARGLGSARSGTEEFWRQRVTSVLGLPLIAGLLVVLWTAAGVDHATARHLINNPLVAALLLLMILNFSIHMRLGAQIIIEDYVHNVVLKPLLLMANTGLVIAVGTVGAMATVKIALVG